MKNLAERSDCRIGRLLAVEEVTRNVRAPAATFLGSALRLGMAISSGLDLSDFDVRPAQSMLDGNVRAETRENDVTDITKKKIPVAEVHFGKVRRAESHNKQEIHVRTGLQEGFVSGYGLPAVSKRVE